MQLPSPMREEVIPKNILMVGPTGWRLAKLADAPFIKVEATKYTELGYVGRDVEDIVKDLVEISINQVRTRMRQRLTVHTAQKAETAIVRGLVGEHADEQTVNAFRELYRRGLLDDKTVELAPPPADASKKGADVFSIMDLLGRADKGAGGLASPRKAGDESKKSMLVGDAKEQIEDQEAERLMQTDMVVKKSMLVGHAKEQIEDQEAERLMQTDMVVKKSMLVGDAKEQIEDQEAERLMQTDMVVKEAVRAAEQDGIIFIDEIDKIVDGGGARRFSGGSVSSEGVQRDLLPIIEGSVVQTKYGPVSTDHMLFICSGAFHSSKPSDMLAELQGRLPIRVELKGLTANDFHRILTEPENSLIKQQKALLATEGVELVRVLADISYTASEKIEEERKAGKSTFSYVVDEAMVEDIIRPLLKKKDLSKYIL
eukprot:gene5244-18479_t